MYALILYAVLVVIGTAVAAVIGLAVERYLHDGLDVLVFIALFFANFFVSWIITRTIVERVLKGRASAAEETTPAA
jgi:hypothetical protein